MKTSDIERIHIRLQVESETVLSLMVAKSGAVNRMGDGSGAAKLKRFFMGSMPAPDWNLVTDILTQDLMDQTGRYEMPDITGERCELEIELTSDKETETGFAFTYGTESIGPPEEIILLVDQAMSLTDDWYEAQLDKNRRN
ncbi:MAG: hypothetical protein AAGI38_20125 [Bacteroidota bacterium]